MFYRVPLEVSDLYHYNWYCLKDSEEARTGELVSDKIEEEAEEEESLRCSNCGFMITTKKECISVDGVHEHTFVNPGGNIFHIGCFRGAAGCVQAGESTTEHSWFKGYAWAYALCGRCLSHLGWVFHSAEGDEFFGLILDRLSAC